MKSRILTMLFMAIGLVFTITPVNAQESKNVTITVSGSGKTQDIAQQAALRSAIEQAFGAFISSKTEVLNDQVVADQMASVSSGNIQSFQMLNESQLPDGSWGVTLKAVVSVDKLTSFVQAKGIAVEIKGGLFALNIKQQMLNEQGEIKAVCEMVELLHEQMQISFDYLIEASEPKSLDAESKKWEIPLVVTAYANKNMDFCANYCIKTLAALSLSDDEVKNYKSLNKDVFPVSIFYNDQTQTFYLRKQISINAINTLKRQWGFYVRGFAVQSGKDETQINAGGDLYPFDGGKKYRDGEHGEENDEIHFLTHRREVAGTFSWSDGRTLAQIEQMTGYSVKPTGVRSTFKHGGLVVYEKEGHGLVVAVADLGELNWNDAKQACADLVLNGYDDWYLPTREELHAIYTNLYSKGLGGMESGENSPYYYTYYWSSEGWDDYRYIFHFGGQDGDDYRSKEDLCNVRAVRAF